MCFSDFSCFGGVKHLIFSLIVFLAPTVLGGEVRKEKDIPYLGPDREEKMDAYRPADSWKRPLPAVIWIHGGGWSGGEKAGKREQNVCRTLAENGYVAFSIDYRLATKAPAAGSPSGAGKGPGTGGDEEGDSSSSLIVPWPQNYYDCKSALRYIRKEAAHFGVDPNRIAVAGGSAGGHLALLTGVTGNVAEMNKGGLHTNQSNKVSCIVDFYGVSKIVEDKRIKKFAGATPAETEANVKAASPATYFGKDTPPILVVHGAADGTVKVRYSREMVEKLKALGIPHEYIEIPGAPHSFDLQPKERDLRPDVLEFLGKHLGKPASLSGDSSLSKE